MDADPRTDDELLAEQRPGEAGAAFAVFYVRHERAVLTYFRRRLSSSGSAADLTAETFAQALISRGRYRKRPGGSAVAWLFGIAGHVLSHSLRRGRLERRARDRLGLPDRQIDADQVSAIDALIEDDAIRTTLGTLPGEQRDAVSARILEDRAYPDIAHELQISEATARKRVSRGLDALRRNLEDSR